MSQDQLAQEQQQPTSDTALYLFKHSHEWELVGHQLNQLGWWNPVFVCAVCTDVILDAHVDMPRGPEHRCTALPPAKGPGSGAQCIKRVGHADEHFDGINAVWHDRPEQN